MKIGIRPVIDGRWGGVRESLEERTMSMAESAAQFIEENMRHADGDRIECIISDSTIGGGAEAAACAAKFDREEVTATLTVTPCWCYGTETMDVSPNTIKAVWGFNGTERPGAVYLAAAMSAHGQKGLPAFSIYGDSVQDADDTSIPEDVKEKILRFVRCAAAIGKLHNKSYVNIGAVSMGIAGSYCDVDFFQKYLGLRTDWVDMSEMTRRIELEIYDKEEYAKALEWVIGNCAAPEHDKSEWEYVVKMTLICKDIMVGNPKLAEMGYKEEALGRNAIAAGFQGQRMWTDYKPNADFTEAVLCSSFDWNGIREPYVFATENDALNAVSMLFGHLLTSKAAVFADVRTYWSSDSVQRVTGKRLQGVAENGIIHLINSGAAALDGTGRQTDANGVSVMKNWWEITEKDISECLKATKWSPANREYFRGGGFSSAFSTKGEMPVTLIRVNLIDPIGPVLQICEGYTAELDEDMNRILLDRTDPTWPSTWFAPKLTHRDAFKNVYSVMANWGSNHGAFVYGHIGDDLITLASMLRIPVSMHNVEDERIFRPHSFAAFGTKDPEGADYRACAAYGPLFK